MTQILEKMMKMHENTTLILRKKEPFLVWIKKTLQTLEIPAELLENSQDATWTLNPTCYLIPLFKDESEAYTYIHKHYQKFFENELAQWCMEDSFWPSERSIDLFKKWFDMELHSALLSLENH